MKNFFDKLGKLGEILAPVNGSSHPFFLAIQHHDNVEVQNLLLNSYDTDMARTNENGYAAIHCACRFNNMFAVDLIMSRGVVIDFPDLQGNTPLHYASKYDHLDLCRILVGRGAFAGRKNDLGQSAYDISKCHIVRQYLLPLQFQSERQHIGGAGLYNGCDNGHMSSSSNYLMPIQLQLQPTEYDSEQPIVNGQLSWQQSQQYNIPPSVYNQTSAPLHQSTHNALDSISSSPHVPPYQLLQSQSQPVPHFQIPGGHLNINYNLNTSYNTPSPICDIYYNKLTDNRITAPVIVSTPNSSGTQSPVEPCSVNTDHSLSSISSYTPGMLNSTPVSSSCHNGPIVQSHNPITIFTASPIQSYRAPTTPSNIQSQSQIYSPSAPVTPRSPPHPFLSSNSNRSHLANNGSQMPQNMLQPMYQSTPLNAPTDPRQGLGPSAHGPPSVVMAGFRPTVKINNVNSGNNRIIQPDGFHTSASDPELQKKYGHTRNIIDIAPPPIFNIVVGNGVGYGFVVPSQNSTYAPQVYVHEGQPPNAYQRYSRDGQKHQ